MKLLNKAAIRLTKNKAPKYDPAKALLWDKSYNSSSWFVIGHFEAEGHKLNYLYHLMISPKNDGSQYMVSALAATDETTGKHYGKDILYPMDQVEIADSHFSIKVPNGMMEGSLDELHIESKLDDIELNVNLDLGKDIIFNAGAGEFTMAVVKIQQYSVPKIKPTGTLTIEGKTYPVSGEAWFDRQWQNMSNMNNKKKENNQKSAVSDYSTDPVLNGTIHWGWLDLNMDCGDKLSVWCFEIFKIKRAWATVLHADGKQEVVEVEPFLINDAGKWHSPDTGNAYPLEYHIVIDKLNTKLTVVPCPPQQEIVLDDSISQYEAASTIRGTYKGKEATGFCYVELVGGFK